MALDPANLPTQHHASRGSIQPNLPGYAHCSATPPRRPDLLAVLAYSQSRATTVIVSPKSSGTVADDRCAAATVSCAARVAANAGPPRTHRPRGRTLPYDVVGNAGGTRRPSADRIWPASISCAGAHEAKTGRVKNSPGTYRLQKPTIYSGTSADGSIYNFWT